MARRARVLFYTGAMSQSPEPRDPPRPGAPLVRTQGNRRTLEFQPGDIQSEMLLSHPDALVLAYARAMMCFALFVPRPRHILMVGLGGGSLAKFCHRHFPHTRITVVEISAEVIALRRAHAALSRGSHDAVAASGTVVSFTRSAEGEDIFCAFNLSDQDAEITLPAGTWDQLGAEIGTATISGARVKLAPWQACLARRV